MHPFRRYAALLDAFYATSWAILPEKYQAIERIIDDMESGVQIDTETAKVRLELDAEHMARMGHKSGEDKPYAVVDNVAVIPMVGTIMKRPRLFGEMSGLVSADKVRLMIDEAEQDDSVKAIVINASSPGGVCEGISECAGSIFSRRGHKRMVAVSNGLMASAAYWIGAAADEVVVNADGLVGSIGVLGTHVDASKYDEKWGIKRTLIGVPSGKALGRDNEPLSDKAYKRKEKVVADLFSVFASDIAKARNLSVGEIKSFDADVFVGSEAVRAGLADRVGTLDEVIAELAKGGKKTIASVPSANHNSKEVATMKWYLLKVAYGGHAAGKAIQLDAEKGEKLVAAEVCEEVSEAVASAVNGGAKSDEPASPGARTAKQVAEDHQAIRAKCRTLFSSREDADEFADKIIGENPEITPDQASKLITDKLCEDRRPIGNGLTPGRSQTEKTQSILGDAIAVKLITAGDERLDADLAKQLSVGSLRSTGEYKIADESYRLSGMSMMRLAQEWLSMSGVQNAIDLDPVDIADLALGVKSGADLGFHAAEFHTPGSFSNLLSTSINKVVRSEFMLADVAYTQWCRVVSDLRDFREQERPRLGETADLAIKPDGDKYPEEQLDDTKEVYRPYEYGKKFSFTRQTFMNDDTGTLNQPSRFARGAARTINRACLAILTDNAALSDSIALFNASHSNLVSSGGAPSIAQLNEIRKLFRLQTGSKSQARLNLRLRYILAPAALETAFEELETSTTRPEASRFDRNIFGPGGRTRWSTIVEPDLDDNSPLVYYGIADPRDATLVEVGFVRGFRTPRVESKRDFDTKGMEFTVETAFGVKALDYQAGVKNPGA